MMMFPAKIDKPVNWIAIACISLIAALAMPYFEGRSNSVWIVPPMFPAVITPFLLLLVSCFALFVRWIGSIRAKRDVAAAGKRFFLCAALFVAAIVLGGATMYRRGFSQYAKTVLTPDEWRTLSRAAQARLKPEGRLPGPMKGSLWTEKEHRVLWSDLCQTTQLQKLDPSLMIFVKPGETSIVWGGAMVGHRSVTVYTRPGARNAQMGFIAEDIAVFVGPD